MQIERSTLDFLQDLKKNNDREWFHASRNRYEAAKNNVLETASELLVAINRFDSSMGYPDLRRCMFRIARDTRFSADKSPYKTNLGVVFAPDGRVHSPLSRFYMHIEPGASFVSCGVYLPEPETLRSIREAIDDEWETFRAILDRKAFKTNLGDLSREDRVLKRVPTGFDKDSPAAEYVKLTRFYAFKDLDEDTVCSPGYVETAAGLFRIMHPLNEFLNRAILNG